MAAVSQILQNHYDAILADWLELQRAANAGGAGIGTEAQRREQSGQFLYAFVRATGSENLTDIHAPAWQPVLECIRAVSTARALAGSTASQTATFLFSLKQPVFNVLMSAGVSSETSLVTSVWSVTMLLDKLGLYSIEVYQQNREEVIRRQQQELLELSTPVVKLVDELIALPLIGTLDSARTQVVMENLLENIVSANASIAILDITGVPTVDTQVAQHLLKTVAAARLMGADCIISGIRPQIAQTIVHLGVELQNVTTKATMADALKVALHRLGYGVVRRPVA